MDGFRKQKALLQQEGYGNRRGLCSVVLVRDKHKHPTLRQESQAGTTRAVQFVWAQAEHIGWQFISDHFYCQCSFHPHFMTKIMPLLRRRGACFQLTHSNRKVNTPTVTRPIAGGPFEILAWLRQRLLVSLQIDGGAVDDAP